MDPDFWNNYVSIFLELFQMDLDFGIILKDGSRFLGLFWKMDLDFLGLFWKMDLDFWNFGRRI